MGKVLQFLLRPLRDEQYLRAYWFKKFHRPLNLDTPRGLNEKTQWLKLYYHRPDLSGMVDKAEAKKYVAAIIGDKYIIPTYGVWDSFQDIDFKTLPEKFVLKATNGGGNNGVVICRDKATFERGKARRRLRSAMRHDIYKAYREWCYKGIKPRIIAEQLLEQEGGLKDYKFFCFNGKIATILVCIGRKGHHTTKYYFSPDWKLQRFTKFTKALPEDFTLPRPERLEEMLVLASKLSKGFPFIRVDLYDTGEEVKFSELTFYTNSGYSAERFPEVDLWLGDQLVLPEKIL
ncbi:MAG: glycosyl transferase [Bacteroidales bacterium]|nr:glycosyl transferase [Bacteroidales bacterium]